MGKFLMQLLITNGAIDSRLKMFQAGIASQIGYKTPMGMFIDTYCFFVGKHGF